ncbi:MAG: CAP domain-containing protein [Chitinispirillia bacterium]|nr:CAP domain-containing protein [Chitinispirillia bacterium]
MSITKFAAAFKTLLVFTANIYAQEMDTAYVPFIVNVDAAVTVQQGTTVFEKEVEANKADTLIITIAKGSLASVLDGARMQINTPALMSGSHGKISLNLPIHSYKNADISLYSLSGKRILRTKANASEVHRNISHPNLMAGVYLLSVKSASGQSLSNRLTHRGGNLNINVMFGGSENFSTGSPMTAANTASTGWTITVSAAEHADSSYTLNLNLGSNSLQSITLYPNSIMKLPNRPLTQTELNAWIARYGVMGGPSEFELEVVRLINIERTSAGRTALEIDIPLMMATRFKSQNMADLEYFSHTSPIYAANSGDYSPGIISQMFGGTRTPSENIARSSNATPASIVNMWMNSEGHRNNILNANSRTIGAGAYSVETIGSNNRPRTETFVTTNFGR